MNIVTIALVELITLHMIDGRVVQVNPKQVTQLVSEKPGSGENKVLPNAVQCVVRFSDGAFLSVAEDCQTVRELMEGEERP
jgi:hypothetical protein